MRKTGTAGLFVFGAHVEPDVVGYNGCLVVLMYQQCKAVVEDEFFVGNVDLTGKRFCLLAKGDHWQSKDH